MTTTGDAVNAWRAVSYYWPEVFAAVSLLAGATWLWRLLRRPRRPGEPYCRRCNYCLKAVSAEICPECGGALGGRMRVIGRPRKWRLGAALLLAAALPLAYAACFPFVPREGAFSEWFNWWSAGLAELAAKHKLQWLADRGGRRLSMIVEMDLATGEVLRIIRAFPSGGVSEIAVGEGPEILAMHHRAVSQSLKPEVVRISARSGRTRQVYPREFSSASTLVDHNLGAEILYFQSWEAEELQALDLRSGAWSVVRRVDMNRRQRGQGASHDPPIIVAVGPDDRRVVVAEDDGGILVHRPSVSLMARTYTVELWDGVARSRLAGLGTFLPISGMAALRDGSRLYATVHGRGLLAWDLDRPEEPPWTLAEFEGGMHTKLAVSPDDRWLFLWKQDRYGSSAPTGSIEVYDLARFEWTERFAVPAGAFVTELHPSGDGRHLAATCGVGGGFQRQISIYDLGGRIAAAAPPPLARPVDVHATDDRGRTRLHHAAETGDTAAARALIGLGADVTARGAGGLTALHLAMARGHWELPEQLMRCGADAGARAGDGSTPFDLALQGRGDDAVARGRIEALHVVADASALRAAPLSGLVDRLASPGAGERTTDELIRRMRTGGLQPADYERLLERCASGDPAAAPLSGGWKATYGRIVEEALRDSLDWHREGGPRLAPGRQALFAIPLEVSLEVCDPCPPGVPITVQVHMKAWWPTGARHQVSATPRLPGTGSVTLSGSEGSFMLPPIGPGETDVTIDLRIEQRRMWDAPEKSVEEREVTVHIRSAA